MKTVLSTNNDNDNDNEEKTTPKKTKAFTKVEVMTAMMEQCREMDNEEDDLNQANFSGMMVAFMKSMMKSKRVGRLLYPGWTVAHVFCKSSVLHILHHVLPCLLYVDWDLQSWGTFQAFLSSSSTYPLLKHS